MTVSVESRESKVGGRKARTAVAQGFSPVTSA